MKTRGDADISGKVPHSRPDNSQSRILPPLAGNREIKTGADRGRKNNSNQMLSKLRGSSKTSGRKTSVGGISRGSK